MAWDSQIQSCSIFERRRRTIGKDRAGQNALVDSDETQPSSQPLNHAMITHSSSDAMGNPGVREDRYRWAAEHASLVKEAHWEKVRNRLKDMVCEVSKKKPTTVIPWLSPDVQRIRFSCCNCKQDAIDHILVFVIYSYSKKVGRQSLLQSCFPKHIQSPRIRLFEMINQRLHRYPSNQFIFPSLANKGTVYGLGNSVSLFYEKPTNNATADKPLYTPSIIVQLQTELDSTKTK
ncbi:LOW QUALITY PROTEIN: hypothetical protein Cgig2_026270 [Carnegiea gigantea]|uniref:Uncharacterized protein n=1 Tax=Carnegiea gigantea TaxID=171969 RepID=A0A9Q1JQN6_9CARY|nr:LOW QUALITY PROTEIN: hypothetical protein Cgig2_026270 [Carnegiea gigantea]